ncbi:MAG: type II secretion system protein, partial [Eubacteriales bacterium]
MKRNSKRGFTIVELVIVIAVIAVLAAVLIPTFISIVKKANTSSDIQLVKNLNIILASEAAAEGKNATMTDALKDAEENGYSVEKLTPTNSDNEILWDSLNDCFVLKEKDKTELNYCGASKDVTEVNNVNLFKIYSTARPLTVNDAGVATSEYSIYLGEGAIADTVTALQVSTGIDVGNTAGLTAISYVNSDAAQSVIIRTGSYDTVLTVNAPNDTVKHYSQANSVDVIAVASASYHEFGDIQGNISLASGRVVAENGAKASAIVITATADQINAGSNAVVIKADNTAAPQIPIVVPEDVKTAIEDKIGSDAIKASEGSVVTDSTAIENMNKFAGGLGTEASPYLIATAEQWKNLCDLCENDSDYSETTGKFFKVINDIDVSGFETLYEDNPNATVNYFAGKIDFTGRSISGFTTANCEGCAVFVNVEGDDVVFENVTMYTTTLSYDSGTVVALELTDCVYGNVTFRNINVYGSATGINTNNNGLIASLAGYCSGYGSTYNYSFENCNIYANVTGSKYVAAFLGAGGFGNNGTITFKNCKNYGIFISTGSSASMLISNCSYFSSRWGGNTKIIVDSCQNLGSIIGANAQYSTLLMNPIIGEVFYTDCATLNGEALGRLGL